MIAPYGTTSLDDIILSSHCFNSEIVNEVVRVKVVLVALP